MTAGGRHLLVEFRGCDPTQLDDCTLTEQVLVAACKHAGCHVLHFHFHKFQPQGVTGIVVLAESHASVHTFPEEQYAALDMFTCGDKDPWDILEDVTRHYDYTCITVREFQR